MIQHTARRHEIQCRRDLAKTYRELNAIRRHIEGRLEIRFEDESARRAFDAHCLEMHGRAEVYRLRLAAARRASQRRAAAPVRMRVRRPVVRSARPMGVRVRVAAKKTASSTADPDGEPPRPRASDSSIGGAT